MQEFVFDVETHLPFLLGGVAEGLLSFAVLLLVLLPVVRHARDASMAKGFLGVAVSFAILLLGIVAVHLLAPTALLALLVGELVAFFACWIVLACAMIARK